MTSWSGGSSFSDLPSWQSSFDTKLPSSLNTGTQAGGGFGSMLGPALGLASAGIGLISGFGQQRRAADIANAQLKFAEQGRKDAFERDKGALAGSMFNQLFGTGTGADLSYGREKAAKQFELNELAPKVLDISSQRSKRERLAAISPEAKEAALFENFLNMKRTGFENASRMEGLFGPTGFSRKFTNI